MNYKLKVVKNGVSVIEISTNQTIRKFNGLEPARKFLRHLNLGGGFDGWTSKLEYYPNSLNPQEVWNIYTKGYSNALSLFGTYQVEISLVKNGNTESSVTF
jgi:hypothetical protein